MQGGIENVRCWFDTPNKDCMINLWTNLVSFVTKEVNLIEIVEVS